MMTEHEQLAAMTLSSIHKHGMDKVQFERLKSQVKLLTPQQLKMLQGEITLPSVSLNLHFTAPRHKLTKTVREK